MAYTQRLVLLLVAISCFFPLNTALAEPFSASIVDIDETVNLIRVEDHRGQRYAVPYDDTFIQDLRTGDRVRVDAVEQEDGTTIYHILDIIRIPALIWLAALFVVSLFLANGKKGLRSLVTLAITFFVLLYGAIPLLLHGWNPVLVVTVGGTLAIGWSIYFLYGWNHNSHVTMVSILSSLTIVALLSAFFIRLASLTGFVSDEITILYNIGYDTLDARGLLLAAFVIGALGVLDDLIISQVSTVEELRQANPTQSSTTLYQAAMRVGHNHTGAIINTLVLAYASTSLPLLILLSIGEQPLDTWSGILNNEVIATEIVRTLVGSIGILLSMPIATLLAVFWRSGGPTAAAWQEAADRCDTCQTHEATHTNEQ